MHTFTTNRIMYKGITIEDGISMGQRFFVVKGEFFDCIEDAIDFIDGAKEDTVWNGQQLS